MKTQIIKKRGTVAPVCDDTYDLGYLREEELLRVPHVGNAIKTLLKKLPKGYRAKNDDHEFVIIDPEGNYHYQFRWDVYDTYKKVADAISRIRFIPA